MNTNSNSRDVSAWSALRAAKRRVGHAVRSLAMRPTPTPMPIPMELDIGTATLSREELTLLKELVRQSDDLDGPIIEVGTLLGLTTTQMALWKCPSKQIITVDNYCWNAWGLSSKSHRALTSAMLRYLVETGQVEMRYMDKAEFYTTYSGPPPALVFLDACHTYEETKKDILWAREVGAQIVSGHDYKPEWPGVIQIVDEFGGPKQLSGSLWVL